MSTPLRRLFSVLATVTVTAGLALAVAARARAATSMTVDGASGGRVFDGVGAVSGGGGNSRLLIDYPEPQRSHGDGTITGVQSGLCLSPAGGASGNGTLLVLATCSGAASQRWTRS